jgi:dolichol-phosphate mannosyltransferase
MLPRPERHSNPDQPNRMPVHLSIVSPVYRAEDCLDELYRRLAAAAEALTPDFELVLVEDGGGDRSWEILDRIAARDPRVKAIRLSRNFGQHYAITAGLDHADGDWVVVMDCDLQDPPEAIGALYARAQEGFDVVFARRIHRVDPWYKTLPGDLFGALMHWLTGTKGDRAVANFSISSRRAVAAFREYRERDRAFATILREAGFSRACVDVAHAPRFAGTTSYTWRKLMATALQIMVSSSLRPLHMSIRFGAVVAGASLLYATGILIRYLTVRIGVPGWTTLAVMISFFFGLLFMQLGIIGLYLGKTFEESKRRPLYHIAEIRNGREPS